MLILVCRCDDYVRIGFDDVIVSELLDQLTADVGIAVIDVNLVLVLLGSGWFVDETFNFLVNLVRIGHIQLILCLN